MKKENVKKFWNKHKKTIKTAVILVTIPVAFIGIYVAIDKVLDKHSEELYDLLENGYGVK